MLRVGIMLDSWKTSAWVADLIQQIQRSDFARVELVVLNTPAPPVKPSFFKLLKNHWKLTAFHKYEQWDYRRHEGEHGGENDSKAQRDVGPFLQGVPVLQVEPLRKGFSDYFPEDDLEAVRSAGLDVLFRFGFRIVRGGLLDLPRYGIWSFHHDDNLQYRGGPPLFWEIYDGNPVSGSILQILTSGLDSGRVIYRGHSATNMRSLYQNRNPVYWKTAQYALRRLRDLHTRGWPYIQSLPTYNETAAVAPRVHRTPHAGQMAIFAAKLFGRAVRASFASRTRGGYSRWFLAIRRRSEAHGFSDTARYKPVPAPQDRFYADPCLVHRAGETYLFFEDYPFREGRAVIACCRVAGDGSLGEPVEVLRRPYHLSYPFVFEHEGEMYMIPETRENRTVELYRAVDFPFRWELDRVLLQDVSVVDTTIHREGDRFWMFAGMSNGRYSTCDELALFRADSPFGPWQPHPASPVISDVRRARPAGAIFRDAAGRLIRPSQDCAKAYGYALNFSEIVTLNETDYEERPISRIEPGWMAGNRGTHTYSCTGEFEVIDGNLPTKLPD